jgi:hypothetical protein
MKEQIPLFESRHQLPERTYEINTLLYLICKSAVLRLGPATDRSISLKLAYLAGFWQFRIGRIPSMQYSSVRPFENTLVYGMS